MYQVLLYYKYVALADPEGFAEEHLALCKALGLKGRIIIAPEGINGTVSGTLEATNAYREHLSRDPRFADMIYKVDPADGHVFKKLFVRAKQELVTLRYEKPLDPNQKTGEYLSPAEWLKVVEEIQREERTDTVILDGRSDYEYDLGHFAGAIRPNVRTFREFPEWIREHRSELEGKRVLTYCTGGIRCEKLTALLMEEWIENVAQLEGGIVSYGKDPKAQGRYFNGKCYVFDERLGVEINHVEQAVVSRCRHCGTTSDHLVNCANLDCHTQHFACESCEARMKSFCSEACMALGRTEKVRGPAIQPHSRAYKRNASIHSQQIREA